MPLHMHDDAFAGIFNALVDEIGLASLMLVPARYRSRVLV